MKRIILTFATLCAVTAFAADLTLKVDLGDSIRPVTHVATGSLYGLTESLPANIDEHVKPLKPNTFLNPAISGNGHQQPIGDAFKAAERIQNTTGKVHIRLADILPGWPYGWKNWQHWESEVTAIVNKKKTCGLTNLDGYEIWNEPYGTWKDANGRYHEDLWKPTYDLLRRLDPETKIIGPSFAYYNSQRMENFIKFCKENNCLPDVISWHQWGSGGFVNALEHYRSLEKKYGISPRKISINEYSSDTHELEGCPGVSVPFIAKFERHGVESAMISWWFTNLPGRLGSLLTANNEKGGGWYLYKWYGDMEGYMAKVTPPNDKSDGVDGFAAVNRQMKEASIILGGSSLGTVNVEIQGIPSWMSGEVDVLVECVTWENKDKAVPAPHEVSSGKYNVVDGKISVPVNVTNGYYAYRIFIVPGEVIPQSPFDPNSIPTIPGTIEAENYDLGSAGVSYYDKDKQNRGEVYREDAVDVYASDEQDGYAIGYAQDGEWLLYTVNIEKEDNYDITARLSCENSEVGIKLYIDDKPITDVITSETTNDEDWQSYIEVDAKTIAKLPEGDHTLKMEIVGSWINIDRLTFKLIDNSSIQQIPTGAGQMVEVYDMRGIKYGEMEYNIEKIKNSLPQGVYLIKTSKETDKVVVKK